MPRIGFLDLPDFVPVLAKGRISLRAPTPADLYRLLTIYNEPDVLASLHRSVAVTREQMSILPAAAMEWASNGQRYSFVIEDPASRQVVGMVELHDIDGRFRQAQLTVFVDAELRRRGYAQAAIERLLDWAFHDLSLEEVHGAVLKSNVASIGLMERIGLRDAGDQDGFSRSGEELGIRQFTAVRREWLARHRDR